MIIMQTKQLLISIICNMIILGADVNAVSGQGYTPLLLAVSLNLEDITMALVCSHGQFEN